MASKTRSVLAAVRTALATINGASGYVHNLSATGRVRGGRPTASDGTSPPCAWVALGRLTSSHGPQLGRYQRNLVIDLEARAPSTADTTEEREAIAADLLDDLATAIETDRTLGGLVLDVIVEGATLDGEECGIPGIAVALVQVSVYWYADSAAGV